jgi:hypothetical protein
VSYSAEDPTVESGEGTAQTTGEVVNDLAEIEVLTNEPNADFVGQKFYIDKDANPDGETKYPLYDAEGNAVGILFTITEAESQIIVDPVEPDEPVVEPVTTKHKLRLEKIRYDLDTGNQYSTNGEQADLYINGEYVSPSTFELENYSAQLPDIGDAAFSSYVEVEEGDEIVIVLYGDFEPTAFKTSTLEQITMDENAVNPTDNPDAYFAGFTQPDEDTLAFLW